jgi:hypothetical protein
MRLTPTVASETICERGRLAPSPSVPPPDDARAAQIAGAWVGCEELRMRHDVDVFSIGHDQLTAALLLSREREHASRPVAELRKDEPQN